MGVKLDSYIVVCDESTKKGKKFSYFYGGAIVIENKYEIISNKLNKYKDSIGIDNELKRVNITPYNYKQYIDIIQLFFEFIKSGDIKMRIMFSENINLEIIPKSQNETYMKFYYLFIRHAFSLAYAKIDIDLRLIFDMLPEKIDRREKFKSYLISNLTHIDKHTSNSIKLTRDRIEEVDSKKHIILQCVDVVVGIVDFYLNDVFTMGTEKSKRWYAKNEVWKTVSSYIYELHPNFDMLQTTGNLDTYAGWLDKYKHFVYKKSANKNAPTLPT